MKLTAAQQRLINNAVHGVVIFPPNYSAWQRIKMTDKLTAAGALVPGTLQVATA